MSNTANQTADADKVGSAELLAFGVVMIEGVEKKSAVFLAENKKQIKDHIKETNEKGSVFSISRQPQYDMFRATHQALTAYNPITAFR